VLAIHVSEGAEALLEELRRRGLDPRMDGDALVVEGVDDEGYDVIRDAIVASGALLYSMAPRQHSLTELFQPDMIGGRS
jgi:hypothetical protein